MMTVVFDGYCVLCSRSVGLLRRLARPGALELIADPSPGQTTVIVRDAGVEYTKSDAVLHVLTALRPPLPALAVLRHVPQRWRDAAYDLVARNRYRWFGRRATCAVTSTSAARG